MSTPTSVVVAGTVVAETRHIDISETEAATPEVTLSESQISAQASKFAAAWDKTPARVFAAAKAVEKLRESNLPGDEIVDALKSAIALEHATSLNRAEDAALIADMAAGIRLSRSAISQLSSAIARARQSKAADAATVSAFYYAALNYVPSAELKRIAAEAEELESGNADFVAECIVVARADAGAARRARRESAAPAVSASSDSEDSTELEQSVKVSKNGAAAFTLAEILRAAEAIASEHPDAAAGIRKTAQMIVEHLAD